MTREGASQQATRSLLLGIELIEMDRAVLARALLAWPTSIRTLDALHLATADYLNRQGDTIELASCDNRLIAAAQALGTAIATL